MITDYLPVTIVASVVGSLFTLLTTFIIRASAEKAAQEAQFNAFRLAALEQRLAAHQAAYKLWDELVSVIHKQHEDKGVIVNRCYNWWIENCLYLDATVRWPFRQQLLYASNYANLYRGTPEAEKTWDAILNIFNLLEKAVGLPAVGMTKEEYEKFLPKTSMKKQ